MKGGIVPTRKKHHITAEDLYRFQLITDCAISPDGRHMVFCLQRVDKKTEKKYSNLWVVPTGRGRARQFTYGDQVDSQAKLSPDGSEIAFISNRGNGKQPQIYKTAPIFVALKKLGIETEMVRFPDEPHCLSRGGAQTSGLKD